MLRAPVMAALSGCSDATSKQGISAHQLSRILEVQYKNAWFLAHRIREAMRDGNIASLGSGGRVRVDETYTGRKKGVEKRPKERGASS